MLRTVILAAGCGSRIKTITKDPKCLLEIGGESILERQIKEATKPTVVVGYKKSKVSEIAKQYRAEIVYNPIWQHTNTLVSFLMAVANNKEDVYLINGDVVYEEEIIDQLYSESHSGCAVQKLESQTDEEVKVLMNNNIVKNIGKHVNSNLESVGVYFFKKEMVEYIKEMTETLQKEPYQLYYEDVLNKCLDLPMGGVETNNAVEIDTPQDYKEAKRIHERK